MNAARALYSLVTWCAQPLLRRKLRRRAVAEPGYGHAVGERFGRYPAPMDSLMPHSSSDPLGRFVWIHAVSLGETRAAGILLGQLREQLPGMRLLLTHGTATGRAEGERLLHPGDVQVWQPWDTPGAVTRFLRKFRPAIGILMETEVWPNLVAGCQRRGVPLVLANARFNATSLRMAQRLAPLAPRPMAAWPPSGPRPGTTRPACGPSAPPCAACLAISSSMWCPTPPRPPRAAPGARTRDAPWSCWPAAARARRRCGWRISSKNRLQRFLAKRRQLSIV